jgi:AmiR/NasT family two-component response regulator
MGKKRIFSSPEDAAWEAGYEERQRELRRLIERAKAELTRDMTVEEREAYEELHRDSGRALRYYIDRAKAEEAKRKSA